ncbi:MAG: hypothetical protein KJP00_10390 [Bacteroidia bacterium]|nr:hypothetical protein [Bacteroidia bacterium]
MNSMTWDQFHCRIPINATIRAIYQKWSTQNGLESWFLKLAEFHEENGNLRPGDEYIQEGDQFRWLWHGYSDEHVEQRSILSANGLDLIKFSFSDNTKVEVRIYREYGMSIVDLHQSEITFKEIPKENLHVQCAIGWTFYLTNLKSILEGGIDLRNKDIALQNVVTA